MRVGDIERSNQMVSQVTSYGAAWLTNFARVDEIASSQWSLVSEAAASSMPKVSKQTRIAGLIAAVER